MSHRDIFGSFPAPTPPRNDPTRLNYRLGLRYEMIKSQPISAEDKYKARMAAREQFTLDPKDVSVDQRYVISGRLSDWPPRSMLRWMRQKYLKNKAVTRPIVAKSREFC